MRRLLALLLFVTVTWAAPTFAAPGELDYLGSYSFVRTTESGHVYISEFRLWRDGNAVRGVYLDVAGLYGDHAASVHPIDRGTLGASGYIEMQAGDYHFTGSMRAGALRGTLRQRQTPLWGGVQGSNEMVLRAGRSIERIPEPECATRQALDQWIGSLVSAHPR